MARELVCEEIGRERNIHIYTGGPRCGPKDVLEQEESILSHPSKCPC